MNIDQNNIWRFGGIVLIVLAVFLGVKTLDAFKDLGGPNPSYNSISVTGEGEIVSIPDVATFNFGVTAEARNVATAQAEVTRKMDAILAELKAQGIEERDIKTVNYTVYPRYSYVQSACRDGFCPPGRQVLDGYTASHHVSIKIRNAESAGNILTLVGERGATDVSGINFTADDPNKLYDEARTQAIKDAREKAEALAKELDVRLVRIVSFYDSTNDPRPVPIYGEGFGGVAVSQAKDVANIPGGENKTVVRVTVIYEIR